MAHSSDEVYWRRRGAMGASSNHKADTDVAHMQTVHIKQNKTSDTGN